MCDFLLNLVDRRQYRVRWTDIHSGNSGFMEGVYSRAEAIEKKNRLPEEFPGAYTEEYSIEPVSKES